MDNSNRQDMLLHKRLCFELLLQSQRSLKNKVKEREYTRRAETCAGGLGQAFFATIGILITEILAALNAVVSYKVKEKAITYQEGRERHWETRSCSQYTRHHLG